MTTSRHNPSPRRLRAAACGLLAGLLFALLAGHGQAQPRQFLGVGGGYPGGLSVHYAGTAAPGIHARVRLESSIMLTRATVDLLGSTATSVTTRIYYGGGAGVALALWVAPPVASVQPEAHGTLGFAHLVNPSLEVFAEVEPAILLFGARLNFAPFVRIGANFPL